VAVAVADAEEEEAGVVVVGDADNIMFTNHDIDIDLVQDTSLLTMR
jgi:hypothetical protein